VILHVKAAEELLYCAGTRQPPPGASLQAARPALPAALAGRQNFHVDELEVADLALAAPAPQTAGVHARGWGERGIEKEFPDRVLTVSYHHM